MAGKYAEGLDENGQWTADTFNFVLQRDGWIANIGQIPDWMKRELDKLIRAGRLAKWKGYWNTGHGGFGFGPLKTIYGYPELAEQAAEITKGVTAVHERRAA